MKNPKELDKEINTLRSRLNKLEKEKTTLSKVRKVTPQDQKLIDKLATKCDWWANVGLGLSKTIPITITADLVWTEGETPNFTNYRILHNGFDINIDFIEIDSIRKIFEDKIKKAEKEIKTICSSIDKLEKKYPGISSEIVS